MNRHIGERAKKHFDFIKKEEIFMKKIIIAAVSCFLLFCVVIGASAGYVYYDFYVNGTDNARYEIRDDFDNKVFAVLGNIEASYSDSTLSSTSPEIKINGVGIYASISRVTETGTLILQINQNIEPFSPFEFDVVDFTVGHKNQNGEYATYSHLILEGYDKNGERLIFEPTGGMEFNNRICTSEFYIRYADNYLKADDIENAFPISVELNGHMAELTRESLF